MTGTRLPAGGSRNESPVEKEQRELENAVRHPSMVALFQAMLGSEEGEVWVGAEGTYYNKPDIDWEKIRDVSKNHLVTEQLERLTSLIFMERAEFHVIDKAEDGREVEDLSALLEEMMTSRGVLAHIAMKRVWVDTFVWGCSLWNPVWSRPSKGKARLTKLRHLPCETFGESGLGSTNRQPGRVFSQILQGITLADPADEDSVEYYQMQAEHAAPVQLKNVWMVKDPSSEELAGSSRLAPLVPVVSCYDFAIKGLMQQVNRGGAPIMLIKVSNAVVDANRDDIALAQKIVRNWGKDTGYLLKDNMEPHVVDTKPNRVAIEAVDYFEKRIKVYISPSTIIQTEGPTLGEGTAAKLDLVHEWLKGEHEVLEAAFEELGDMWLNHNGYPSTYRTDVRVPVPTPDDPQVNVLVAQAMFTTQSGTKDEIRERLGLEPMNQRTRRLLEKEYAAPPPPPPLGSIFPGWGGPEEEEEGHGPPAGIPRPGHGPSSPASATPLHTGLKDDTHDPLLERDLKDAVDRAKAKLAPVIEEELEAE